MKAIICEKYGPPEVLQYKEIPKPIPKDHEVLIKVRATTVHIGDTKVRSLRPGFGPVRDFFFKPAMRFMMGFKGPRVKILGMELSGEIEDIGKQVSKFKKGDAIFASTEFEFGSYVEYRCMPEDGILALKPNHMSFEEAAPVSNGGLTALLNLRKTNIKPGEKVLIYGASGSVGTYAVQIARHFGGLVTGVCSTSNLEMVRLLGADELIDYTEEDISEQGPIYDVVLDTVGKLPKKTRKKILKPKGRFVSVLTMSAHEKIKVEDLYELKDLCESGSMKTVIDRTYDFDQMIEAHRYVDKGHKKGNVVIKVS